MEKKIEKCEKLVLVRLKKNYVLLKSSWYPNGHITCFSGGGVVVILYSKLFKLKGISCRSFCIYIFYLQMEGVFMLCLSDYEA